MLESLFREIDEALDRGDLAAVRQLATLGATVCQALGIAALAESDMAAGAQYFAAAACLTAVVWADGP
jgi:hypothetical protein